MKVKEKLRLPSAFSKSSRKVESKSMESKRLEKKMKRNP